jgi:hypothetical protein
MLNEQSIPVPKPRWHLSLAILLLGYLAAMFPVETNAAPRPTGINLIPNLTSLTFSNGQLLAGGNVTTIVNGQTNLIPFSGVPVNISLAEDQTGAGACPILDLALGPITLDVLGLIVETSPICLQLTAYDGAGLLGDLLCSVAGLLNGGLNLEQILSGLGTGTLPGLSTAQLGQLLPAVQNLLNGALANLLDAVVTGLERGNGQQCGVLHLELGPLNLNLLGLEVILDDCDGGPVVVDINAERGPGNLLGNLLCGLLRGGRLDLGATLEQILGLLSR